LRVPSLSLLGCLLYIGSLPISNSICCCWLESSTIFRCTGRFHIQWLFWQTTRYKALHGKVYNYATSHSHTNSCSDSGHVLRSNIEHICKVQALTPYPSSHTICRNRDDLATFVTSKLFTSTDRKLAAPTVFQNMVT